MRHPYPVRPVRGTPSECWVSIGRVAVGLGGRKANKPRLQTGSVTGRRDGHLSG